MLPYPSNSRSVQPIEIHPRTHQDSMSPLRGYPYGHGHPITRSRVHRSSPSPCDPNSPQNDPRGKPVIHAHFYLSQETMRAGIDCITHSFHDGEGHSNITHATACPGRITPPTSCSEAQGAERIPTSPWKRTGQTHPVIIAPLSDSKPSRRASPRTASLCSGFRLMSSVIRSSSPPCSCVIVPVCCTFTE